MDDLDPASLFEAGHPLAADVAERVRSVISAAEAAANAVRHEADQEAQTRRRIAEQEAREYLEAAKRDAEAHLQQRTRRIAELSDSILERAEAIVARLDRAEEVKRQLQVLVETLGDTAERLAVDAAGVSAAPPPMPPSSMPPVARPVAPAPVREAAPPPQAAPAPASEPYAEPAAAAPPAAPASEPRPVAPVERSQPAPEPDLPLEDLLAPEPAGEADLNGAASHDVIEPLRPRSDDAGGQDEQLGARLVALQMAVAGGNRGEVEEHLRRAFDVDDPTQILDDVFGRGSRADKRVAWPETAGEGGVG